MERDALRTWNQAYHRDPGADTLAPCTDWHGGPEKREGRKGRKDHAGILERHKRNQAYLQDPGARSWLPSTS